MSYYMSNEFRSKNHNLKQKKRTTFCRRAQKAGSMAAAFDATRKIECLICSEKKISVNR